MSWADVVIVLVCLASGGFGFWRGFAKEAIALATWLAAIWLAWQSSWLVEPVLGEWAVVPEARIWVARGIVFVAVLAAGGLIAWLMRAVVRRSGLSSTDRSLGALFGLVRGVLIVGLLVIGLQFSGLDQERWWQTARLKPVSDRIADGIRYYAEIGTRYIRERELAGIDGEVG